jgi:hypothetical protein
MFSYACIISTVHVRRKRSFDAILTKLDFMAAVWREYENHYTLLAPLFAFMDKHKSWLSSNINTGVFFFSKTWLVL